MNAYLRALYTHIHTQYICADFCGLRTRLCMRTRLCLGLRVVSTRCSSAVHEDAGAFGLGFRSSRPHGSIVSDLAYVRWKKCVTRHCKAAHFAPLSYVSACTFGPLALLQLISVSRTRLIALF